MKQVPIVSAGVAYDCPNTYTTYLLIFHQVLYVDTIDSHLICPNQLRLNSVIVNECPVQYTPLELRTNETHSIRIGELLIPMSIRGVISYFNVRKPTYKEVEDPSYCTHVEMTCSARWDPNGKLFTDIERSLRLNLDRYDTVDTSHSRQLSSVTVNLSQISTAFDCNLFYLELESNIVFNSKYLIAAYESKRKGKVTAAELCKRWFIGAETAKRTLERTTQRGVRDFSHTKGTKRLKHTTYQLRYRYIRASVYTDTMFSTVKSIRQNICAQVYVTEFQWTKVYPMRKRSEAHLTLDRLHHDVGIFHTIIPDNAPELAAGDFRKKALHAGSQIKPIEAYTHNQNMAEAAIRELRRMYRRAMRATNSPHVLWDYCLELMAEIRSNTALDIMTLKGDTPSCVLTGDTPDISHLCEFSWYDYVWFIDSNDQLNKRKLARYLGPSHDIGQAMASKILNSTGRELSYTSVIPLSVEDRNDEIVKKQITEYDDKLKESLGQRMEGIPIDDNDDDEVKEYEPYEDESQPQQKVPEADDMDYDSYHKFVSARVMLPQGDTKVPATVLRRKRDEDGNLIGKSHENPLLDTSFYEVQFEDGHVEAYAANIIAESIFSQVDDEGHEYLLLDEIVDHKKMNDAVNIDDGFIVHNGVKRPRRTTKGWKLMVQWKDGSSSWHSLADLKESNPVEVAEYAVGNKLVSEPAFSWWVPYTIRKRDRIVAKIKTRYFRKEQKFGIPLPKTVQEALQLDKESGTKYWENALKKEMLVIKPAVEILEEGQKAPVGYQEIPCHVVFDIKMDFSRKARYVAGGHVTSPPTTQTYASVVSRDSVRIAFLYAALNDLDVMSADIQGAYLNAPCKEKVYTICGHEFGAEFRGRVAIIVKALYGLKTSAFAWREHLAETLREALEFSHCIADNDVWMRPATKKSGDTYYQLCLVHTDDMLVISESPREILNKLDQHYVLKPDSIGKPTQYLGAEIGEYRLADDPSKIRWYMSSDKYIKEAVRNVKGWLSDRGHALKSKAPGVFPSGYRAELDTTPLCDDDSADYYQQQIGVLRWSVELGRIDIATEVSMLAAYTAAPRQGHFAALLHIFSYLNSHNRSKLVFDDGYVSITDEVEAEWKNFYPEAKEEVPVNAPEPKGKPMQILAFIDADHAGDMLTRKSRTGVLLFLNRAPIVWYTKKQNTVETSTFGSEFVALKVGIELVKALKYKLWMLGIPIDGHAHLRVDNMSVVKNTTTPESTLKKKSNSIAYHFCREYIAGGGARVGYEESGNNKADMLTKVQTGPERQRIMSGVLY